MDIARVEIEMALPHFRRVGNDRADAKRAATKAVELVSGRAAVVVELLDPAANYPQASAELEALNSGRFQIGKDSILKMGGWVFRIERECPCTTHFDVSLWENLCVSDARNEGPGVVAQVSQPTRTVFACWRPK